MNTLSVQVVINFPHWTLYVHVRVHVVYVSVTVFYCADGLSRVVLSFMYPISKLSLIHI